ncbi:MAG: hypothetical protein R2715_09695 [Ilumatobacteraceae bacterium]
MTSTAHTEACGERRAIVRAIGPAPQPRSSRSPLRAGAGASRSNNRVPVSRLPWLKTPRSVVSRNEVSGRATSIVIGLEATDGEGSKYWEDIPR